MEETQEQTNNRPWLYVKGQSGNPGGRPKGSKSMKTWLRERLETMSDEERENFIEGINKIDLFKMAEGNPTTQTDITTKGESILATKDPTDPEIMAYLKGIQDKLENES